MLKAIIRKMRIAFVLVLIFTLITGVIYPLMIKAISDFYCPWKAKGSLIYRNGIARGSMLIGQSFDKPNYFWGRLSATPVLPYNAMHSSGSNYGPLDPALLISAKKRIEALHQADLENKLPIPVDLATSSASGLDPDISVEAAVYQIPRIAKNRKIAEKDIQVLVQHLTKPRRFGVMGEPRVNVLELNLALDGLESSDATTTS